MQVQIDHHPTCVYSETENGYHPGIARGAVGKVRYWKNVKFAEANEAIEFAKAKLASLQIVVNFIVDEWDLEQL